MEIYNKFKHGGDSSDDESNKMWSLLKKDTQIDVNLGDKVYLRSGDLKGTIGKIISFENNTQDVVLKPINLEGFDDDLAVEKV